MPGKSQATRKSPTLRPVRRFTVLHANQTLPLVSRIVTDIVSAHRSFAELKRKPHMQPVSSTRAEMSYESQRLIERLQHLTSELNDIGCELRDFASGEVQFIARHDGRDICLMWKLGDQHITHWHELTPLNAPAQSVEMLDAETMGAMAD